MSVIRISRSQNIVRVTRRPRTITIKHVGPRGIQGPQGPQGEPGATALPDGGTTRQLLGKQSNADGDVTWLSITKTDVGLANVDNTSDASKPVSTATQTALNAKANQADLDAHEARTDNPHAVTKAQVGLGSVPNVDATQRSNHTGTQTAATISDFSTAADARISAQKAQPNGLATLDSGGVIPTSQMPALAIGETFTAASQAAMLALAAQQGDIAVRTDTSTTWILAGTDPTQLANWKQLATPPDAVLSVNSQTGVVVLAKGDVGLGNVTNDAQLKASQLDTDGTLAANSDTRVASQKATKTYADTKATKGFAIAMAVALG